MKEEKEEIFIPQSLTEARTHYCPPNKEAITCSAFGNYDSGDRGCGYCIQLHPYEAEMCADETQLKELMALNPIMAKNKELAIKFIEEHKNKYGRYRDQKNI